MLFGKREVKTKEDIVLVLRPSTLFDIHYFTYKNKIK
jgi:hypothetical protein